MTKLLFTVGLAVLGVAFAFKAEPANTHAIDLVAHAQVAGEREAAFLSDAGVIHKATPFDACALEMMLKAMCIGACSMAFGGGADACIQRCEADFQGAVCPS